MNESKLRLAESYQEDVMNPIGPTVPLTAETLRRQQRRRGPGSTYSSQSRDESDYKNSATTRTTRSMSNDDNEDVVIKVTGQAQVVVGDAQIDCNEGGEIETKRQIRNSSERSSSEYGGGGRLGPRRNHFTKMNHKFGKMMFADSISGSSSSGILSSVNETISKDNTKECARQAKLWAELGTKHRLC